MERGFNAGQTHRSMCTSISSTVYEIMSYSEILVGNCNFFSTSLAFNATIGGVPIGIPGKILILIKLESGSEDSSTTG